MSKPIACLMMLAPLAASCMSSGPEHGVTLAFEGSGQLYEGMGEHHRPITTSSPEAQAYFDQGLTWLFAFNHAEATRSFLRAAELDPACAMAWWGVSIAAGPQYNHPRMSEERTAQAWTAMQAALDRIENTTPVERALIEALRHRNPEREPEDRTGLNEAYAAAMGEVWQAHPEDADVGMFFAEATMVLQPWKLYDLDHAPHAITPEVMATLERVIELNPNHPGALHLYIHATEPSADPYRAVEAAHRLSKLVPASGHLLHMPSHTYVKTGHWEEAVAQNVKAMAADDAYRAGCEVPMTQHSYMVHNSHMRAYASMMTGREAEAMEAARDMWADLGDEDILRAVGPRIDRWMCSIWDVQKRFGRWDAILSEPAPPEFLPLTLATWHAARAVAYAAKKDFESAEREHEVFRKVCEGIPDDTMWGRDVGLRVLEVSDHFIAGEIALQRGDWANAAEHLEQAAEVEDTLSYGEPPQWLQPMRHTLGAVYLKAGRFADAERAYREDLAKWPRNGWSLFGLSRALEEQGKTEEAATARAEYREVWKHADEEITTSCKCIPET